MVIPCEVGNKVGAVQWVKDGFAYVIQPSEYIITSVDCLFSDVFFLDFSLFLAPRQTSRETAARIGVSREGILSRR